MLWKEIDEQIEKSNSPDSYKFQLIFKALKDINTKVEWLLMNQKLNANTKGLSSLIFAKANEKDDRPNIKLIVSGKQE